MNYKEADEIIKNYKPHKNFFDLSNKPKTIGKMEYAKILDAQNFLADQNEQSEYLKKFNPSQWGQLKQFSAELQQIIFQHWSSEELFQDINEEEDLTV